MVGDSDAAIGLTRQFRSNNKPRLALKEYKEGVLAHLLMSQPRRSRKTSGTTEAVKGRDG
jgi:hypothetical protein